MENLGIDAVNMNDAVKIASGKSGTEYGATVSVYNATNTFLAMRLKCHWAPSLMIWIHWIGTRQTRHGIEYSKVEHLIRGG